MKLEFRIKRLRCLINVRSFEEAAIECEKSHIGCSVKKREINYALTVQRKYVIRLLLDLPKKLTERFLEIGPLVEVVKIFSEGVLCCV